MTDFNNTNWAKPGFGQHYRENADIFIVERRRMLAILKSFYIHFVKKERTTLLDLGCGDGIVTSAVAEADGSVSATLVDGSEDMLTKARERLRGFSNAKYICATFQDLLRGGILTDRFDIAASSLAIHHLTMDEKASFFETIYSRLNDGGYFVNIDVVLAPDENLEKWYLQLWQEWMDEKRGLFGIGGDPCSGIITRYKQLEENKPDRLEDQLRALIHRGFKEVDCYYKYGIFTMYGGRK